MLNVDTSKCLFLKEKIQVQDFQSNTLLVFSFLSQWDKCRVFLMITFPFWPLLKQQRSRNKLVRADRKAKERWGLRQLWVSNFTESQEQVKWADYTFPPCKLLMEKWAWVGTGTHISKKHGRCFPCWVGGPHFEKHWGTNETAPQKAHWPTSASQLLRTQEGRKLLADETTCLSVGFEDKCSTCAATQV